MNKKTFIFHYSKNYGSLTCVIKLKVAVNMADPTCLFWGQFAPLISLLPLTVYLVLTTLKYFSCCFCRKVSIFSYKVCNESS